jgi:hypothetical protein
MDDIILKANDAVQLAQNASGAEQLFSGLLFLGFVYYFIWIPVRENRAGRKVAGLFTRIKTDLGNLLSKLRS